MHAFALIILLVLGDGTARVGASPFDTRAACEAKAKELAAEIVGSGAAAYSLACVPVRAVRNI